LAELQENNDLLMTPFERNLEVWRQLWRVIERSDLVVQIVDARNPLLFRSEDLEIYVKAVDPKKENLLLVNKADMMTLKQRTAWAKYLSEAGIAYKFFSAALAKEQNEARLDNSDEDDDEISQPPSSKQIGKQPLQQDRTEKDTGDDEGVDTQILTVEELEGIFLKHAPQDAGMYNPPTFTNIH
jgi:large subunit GTPase 1